MYYHAYLRLEGGFQWWANLSQAELIADIVLPFANRQIRTVRYGGGQALLNFGGAVYLRLFKSEGKAPEPDVGDWVRTGANPAIRDCTTEILGLAPVDRAGPASRSVLEIPLSGTKRQVFVVMQFGNADLDSAYQGVIKPVANEHGYGCLRIDEVQGEVQVYSEGESRGKRSDRGMKNRADKVLATCGDRSYRRRPSGRLVGHVMTPGYTPCRPGLLDRARPVGLTSVRSPRRDRTT